MPITFACIAPHPPLLLPSVGSDEDKEKVKKTIEKLEELGKRMEVSGADLIIIFSPHPDWGFNVPLYFLAKDFRGRIEKNLTGANSPSFYYKKGKELFNSKIINSESKIALIASGDLSHHLREDGPYGFREDGLKFDEKLVEALSKKNVQEILQLENMYPGAGECGLRSFCALLGVLEESGMNYNPEILSYEGPLGVGYLTADLKLQRP